MLASLMWKGWREHVWKMVALLALGLVPLLAARSWVWGADLSPAVLAMMAALLPGFVAMWTVTGEKEARRATAALPVRPGVAFSVRMGWGLVTLLVPVVVGVGVCYTGGAGWGQYGSGATWLRFGLMAVVIAVQLYLWSVVAALGRRDEVGAAMMGLVVVVVSAGLLAALGGLAEGQWGKVWWLMMIHPLGIAAMEEELKDGGAAGIAVVLAGQVTMMVVLWMAACWRYGRLVGGAAGVKRGARQEGVGLALTPRPPLGGVLLWKAWREIRWVSVLALVAAVVLPVVVVGIGLLKLLSEFHSEDWGLEGRIELAHRIQAYYIPLMLRGVLFGGIFAGPVLGIVLGIGTTCEDLRPGLMGFWRSRPLSAGRMFGTKYAVGVAATVVTAVVPVVLVLAAAGLWRGQLGAYETPVPLPGAVASAPRVLPSSESEAVRTRNTIRYETESLRNEAEVAIAVLPVGAAFAFSLATALGVLLRRAIYAGILSLTAVLGLALLPGAIEWIQALTRSWTPWQMAVAAAGALGAGTVACAVVGLTAAVKDWYVAEGT